MPQQALLEVTGGRRFPRRDWRTGSDSREARVVSARGVVTCSRRSGCAWRARGAVRRPMREAGRDEAGSRIVAGRNGQRSDAPVLSNRAPLRALQQVARDRVRTSPIVRVSSRLSCARRWTPQNFSLRESHLSAAYEAVAPMHNHLAVTAPLDPSVRHFHDRPYLVLDAERFANALTGTMMEFAGNEANPWCRRTDWRERSICGQHEPSRPH